MQRHVIVRTYCLVQNREIHPSKIIIFFVKLQFTMLSNLFRSCLQVLLGAGGMLD
jgi:hypothetical protein